MHVQIRVGVLRLTGLSGSRDELASFHGKAAAKAKDHARFLDSSFRAGKGILGVLICCRVALCKYLGFEAD